MGFNSDEPDAIEDDSWCRPLPENKYDKLSNVTKSLLDRVMPKQVERSNMFGFTIKDD